MLHSTRVGKSMGTLPKEGKLARELAFKAQRTVAAVHKLQIYEMIVQWQL
jgi:hypothetical protein